MTISSETRKAGPYTGNGVTTSFAFAFKVFTTADVLVVRTNLSAVESTLVLTTDYTVTLNSNQDSNPGGSVILPTALTTGFLLTLSSQVGALQATDLTNQGGFYPSVLNTALDKLTILVQQLKEQVGRAVKTDISSSVTPAQLISTLNTNAANAVASAASSAASATASANSATTSSNAAATTGANVTAAGNSQTAAAASAAAALTSKNNAATSETNSGNSATAAASSATSANTSKVNAATSETNAGNSATAAAASAASAATSLDSFKKAYQGAYAGDPTLRYDGSALQTGDLAYNTLLSTMRVYKVGTGWSNVGVQFNPISQTFSGTGAQTAYTLSASPGVAAAIIVLIGGVGQTPTTDYTVSGTTLTFTSAPPAGTNNITVINFGQAGNIAIPANNSITAAMIQAGAIAGNLGYTPDPSGKVSFFAMNTAPTGWLKANGAAISRTTYATLFAAIGTTFGVGDGSTTFNIPDMRGYFARGWVDNGTVDSGRAFGSTQAGAIQSHTHQLANYGGNGSVNTAGGSVGLIDGFGPFNTNATGGTETRPVNIALLACIKY